MTVGLLSSADNIEACSDDIVRPSALDKIVLNRELEQIVCAVDVSLRESEHRCQVANSLAPISDGCFAGLLGEHMAEAVRSAPGPCTA